ncbi:MAG TPA: SPFH domain-containing protein [Aggregatilineales bacterium]|nr:SPFH domain-containing protein [Aggregatilineales bacterium]
MDVVFSCLAIFVIIGVILVLLSLNVVKEYERGVIFRLGRYTGTRGPGLIIVIPIIEQIQKVGLRTVTLDVPPQDCITNDNVTVRVNAVAYYHVMSPQKAIIEIQNFNIATLQIAQTTLRSVVGQVNLDELLADREAINHRLQTAIDEHTDPWGVKVSIVEIKDVELPDSMKRSMARQAEAEREKRAKIIHASGEFEAARQLLDAAQLMEQSPAALQLRYLQSLVEISVEKNSTIIFPMPIDFMQAFTDLMKNRDNK